MLPPEVVLEFDGHTRYDGPARSDAHVRTGRVHPLTITGSAADTGSSGRGRSRPVAAFRSELDAEAVGMMPLRIFLSSVQKEFAAERAALRDYLRGDVLMRHFFEVFLFEEVPASDRRADALYLDEVDRCDLYIGVFGDDYGAEDAEGISPTEREFARATKRQKPRLVFVKGGDDTGKHPKMQALIRQAGGELIRRRFSNPAELVAAVDAALVRVPTARRRRPPTRSPRKSWPRRSSMRFATATTPATPACR